MTYLLTYLYTIITPLQYICVKPAAFLPTINPTESNFNKLHYARNEKTKKRKIWTSNKH